MTAQTAMASPAVAPTLTYHGLQQADGKVGPQVGSAWEDLKNIPGQFHTNYSNVRRRGAFLPAALYSLTLGTIIGIALGLCFSFLFQFVQWSDTIGGWFIDDKQTTLVATCHNGTRTVMFLLIASIGALADAMIGHRLTDEEAKELKTAHYIQSTIAGCFAFASAWLIFGTVGYLIWDASNKSGEIAKDGAIPLLSAYGFRSLNDVKYGPADCWFWI